MTTLDNLSNTQQPSLSAEEEARKKAAKEALKSINDERDATKKYINWKERPSGEFWFDATKQEPCTRDWTDPKTGEKTTYPGRKFKMLTRAGNEKEQKFSLSRATEINEILFEKGGCAWIKVTKQTNGQFKIEKV